MIICVTAGKGRPVQLNPDPATVVIGDTVIWQLRYIGSDDPVELTIYFDRGTPFKGWKSKSTQTSESEGEVRDGSLDGGSVGEAGDYKYGVRLSNARTKEKLSDDDPWLKVVPAG